MGWCRDWHDPWCCTKSHYPLWRRWRGRSTGTSDDGWGYRSASLWQDSKAESKLQLPLSSIVEDFKTGKTRLIMTLKDSRDEKVSRVGVEVRTGRKWSATKAVDKAESRPRHSDIVGTVCHGRQGLGQQRSTRWRGASTSDRRDLV